jgi:hypothetical protein
VSAAEDRAAAEQAKLDEALVVTSAESEVCHSRMADLVEAHRGARARWSAAKGQLTRAMKDGSAGRIAAAQERERAAWAEFDHVGRESIEEMFTLNRGGLDDLGRVLDQIGPTWDAQAEVTRQLADPEAEAGQ